MRFILFSLFICILLLVSPLHATIYEVGRYDNPRNDFTLRIKDPFPQENVDLMQPVIGDYDLKVLPSQIPNLTKEMHFNCEGLYFKQIGRYIYIDVRKLPEQDRAGLYDLYVSLKIPGEDLIWSRLERKIKYVDSAADVVLVIDNSRSMEKNDPHDLRFAAVENFVQLASLSNKIDQIAVVKFSADAKLIMPWTSTENAKKENIGKTLARSRQGNFTNINDAFQLSATLFEDSIANDKICILLTDGKNEPDIYRDTHKYLIEQGVRIYTVGLSEQADTQVLQQIAYESNGDYFSAVDDEKLLRIYNQIAQEINDFKPMIDGQAVGEIKFPMVGFDEFIDINLFGYQKGTKFSLFGPEGKKIALTKIFGSDKGKTSMFRIQAPKAGNYVLKANDKDITFNYNIHTLSDLFLKAFPLEKKFLQGEVAHFAASLAIRDKPITGIDVIGKISNANGVVVEEVKLFDDGVHGDNHADDGVYCGIYPIQLEEGAYSIELKAEGVYGDNIHFIRTDKLNFYVLHTEVESKDFFLASILPLYVDFGQVEQGTMGISNVRLSFEGLHERLVTFNIREDFKFTGSKDIFLKKENFLLPEKLLMKPSQAEVVSFKVKVPKETQPGTYTSLVTIQLEDQEIDLPIDLIVKKSKIKRPVFEKPSLSKVQPKMLDLTDFDTISSPEKQEPSIAPSLVMSNAQQPKIDRFEDNGTKVTNKIQVTTPKGIFNFKVLPEINESFIADFGQSVEASYTLINTSSKKGIVELSKKGYGEFIVDIVELEPGENLEILWNWKVDTETSEKITNLNFSSGNIVHSRQLTWSPPPPKDNTALWITLIMLGAITVVYGFKFLSKKQKQDLFISFSAACHFLLVLYALYHLVEKYQKLPEEDDEPMVVELIEEEQLEEPKPESKPEPKPEPKVVQEKPPKKVQEVEPIPLPEPELIVEQKQVVEEDAPSFTLTRESVVEVQKSDTTPQAQEPEVQSIALEEYRPEPTQTDRSDWVMESEIVEKQGPKVLSLTRRVRRAVLKKRTVKEETPESQFAKEMLRSELSKVKTKRPDLTNIKQSKLDLKELERTKDVQMKRNIKEIERTKTAKKQRKLEIEVDLKRIALKKKIEAEELAKKLKLQKQTQLKLNKSNNKKELNLAKLASSANIKLQDAKRSPTTKMEYQKKTETLKLVKENTAENNKREINVNQINIKEQQQIEANAKQLELTKNTAAIAEAKLQSKIKQTKRSVNQPDKILAIAQTTESGAKLAHKLSELKEWNPEDQVPLKTKDAVGSKPIIKTQAEDVQGSISMSAKKIIQAKETEVEVNKLQQENVNKSDSSITVSKRKVNMNEPEKQFIDTKLKREFVRPKNLRKRTTRATSPRINPAKSIEPAEIDF